eukprot:6211136-Pleurochrysis_carterae.AAC.1
MDRPDRALRVRTRRSPALSSGPRSDEDDLIERDEGEDESHMTELSPLRPASDVGDNSSHARSRAARRRMQTPPTSTSPLGS